MLMAELLNGRASLESLSRIPTVGERALKGVDSMRGFNSLVQLVDPFRKTLDWVF
jgi:hypothetical protein